MRRHGRAATGWRGAALTRTAAAVPAVVLVASGLAAAADLPAAVPEAADRTVRAAPASDVTGPEVPDAPLDAPASVSGSDGHGVPGLVLPPPTSADGRPGDGRVRVDATGIPYRALRAYHHAADLLGAADPACRLDWSLVAAIGRVESNHGRFGGSALDGDGVARPGIVGIRLDGAAGTASIADSDGGAWDGDAAWDRAVGPMQFIPGTWRMVGSDAEPDGVRNPQDIDDAAAATGVYLCAGPGDLLDGADRYEAVYRYNHSDSYVRTVLAIAGAYARGVQVVSASALPAARTEAPAASPARPTTPPPGQPAPPPAPDERPDPAPQPDPQPQPEPQPEPQPPVLAGGPVGGAVGGAVEDATGAVEDTVETAAPALPPLTEVLDRPVLPEPDQVCVDANREPVALVSLPLVGDALCPVGAFLMPKP